MAQNIALVASLSGLSSGAMNLVKGKLTDEEYQQFLTELQTSWEKFKNAVNKRNERFNWAITEAKKAIMKSTLTEDEKLEALSLLDIYSHGPSLLMAFLSNFNLPTLISTISLIIAGIMMAVG